jgi:hypothetical protein
MPNPALLKTTYRILTWTSFAGLLLMLALILRKPPTPQVSYDPTAGASVDQKFAVADQAKASGQPAQVQLNTAELNSYLAQGLQLEGSAAASGAALPVQAIPPAGAGSGVPGAPATANGEQGGDPTSALGEEGATLEQVQSSVKDVKVDMDGDLVKAYVTFDFHDKDLSLELDGHLAAQGGYLKFEPVAGKLGSLPLPQSALDSAVEKMMSSPENREKLRLPPDISNIQIVDGQAVVSYK